MEAYFLSSTQDTRDRSQEILQLLQTHKVCILGSGVYYVSGITMPEGTSLFGMGDCTRLVLSEEVTEGYTLRMHSRCAVKNLTLLGTTEEMDRPTEVGTRHGIGFIGTATTTERSNQPTDAIISGCQIRNFTGGGITCTDTGYNINASLCVSDCRIHCCGAGINITHFSEYHKFTNVVSTRNLYGCINNGGNNVFTGCAFDGNTLGYLIDNSEKQSNNNAHGSCIGCTFNHTNFNKGIGIKILGSTPGYVFSGCQIFFSEICLENSKGIQFDNINFGKDQKISVKGGTTIFSGCVFSHAPTWEIGEDAWVKVHECYTKNGEAVVLP